MLTCLWRGLGVFGHDTGWLGFVFVERGACLLLQIGFMKRERATEHEREGEAVLIGILAPWVPGEDIHISKEGCLVPIKF